METYRPLDKGSWLHSIRQYMGKIAEPVVLGLGLGFLAGCASAGDIYNRPGPGIGGGRTGSGDFIPNPTAESLLTSPQDMAAYLQREGECDLAHLVELDGKGWELLACEEKIGDNKYRTKWRINLTEMCGVYVKENYQTGLLKPIDWFTSDDVVISNSVGEVYPLKLDDEMARSLSNIIALYAENNERRKKCGPSRELVALNYSRTRPLTSGERRDAGRLLALRKGGASRSAFAASDKDGNSTLSSGGRIFYRDSNGNMIAEGKTTALFERSR